MLYALTFISLCHFLSLLYVTVVLFTLFIYFRSSIFVAVYAVGKLRYHIEEKETN